MNFSTLSAVAIPQGNVVKIHTITNLVRSSIDSDHSLFNDCGYQNGFRVRSNGALGEAQYGAATGYIHVVGGEVIRFKGGNWNVKNTANCVCFCDSSFTALGSFTTQPAHYGICTTDNSVVTTENGYCVLTVPNDSKIEWVRISMYCPDTNYDAFHGKDLVVLAESGTKIIWERATYTVELIGGVGYTVKAIEGFNSIVVAGGSFSFSVNILDGYTQDTNFAVKVNGATITDVDGVYTIANVTENKIVTVEGVIVNPTNKYTNLVRTSVDASGNIYNGDGNGYKTDTRLSSSSGNDSSGANGTVTGFIKVKSGDVIRIASAGDIINWHISNATNCIHYYNSSKSTIGYLMGKGTYSGVCTSTNSVVTEEEYRKKYRLTVPDDSNIEWVRIGIYGPNGAVGEDLIVTVNEEIT